jgi:hypothetical protein
MLILLHGCNSEANHWTMELRSACHKRIKSQIQVHDMSGYGMAYPGLDIDLEAQDDSVSIPEIQARLITHKQAPTLVEILLE